MAQDGRTHRRGLGWLHAIGERLPHRDTNSARASAPGASYRYHRRRRIGAALVASGTFFAAVSGSIVGFSAIASANAANPLATTTGSTSVLPSGKVQVSLQGTWDWGTLSNSSTQTGCSNRYGVGWAVDWADSTVPYTLTSKSGYAFHVGSAMDGIYQFTNPCQQTDAQGHPQGPWSATHTYNSISEVPQDVCVNMYDLHGSPGSLKPSTDIIPTQNNDNSIQKNDFNPTLGKGYCFSPNIVLAQSLSGNVFQCVNNAATTNVVPGATLEAQGGTPAGSITGKGSQFTASNVNPGGWTVKATVPSTFQLVAGCNGSPQSTQNDVTQAIVDSAVTAHEAVIVPSNGTGSATFYATPVTTPTPVISLTKSASNSTVTSGDSFSYTLVASNVGTVDAPSTVVTDAIPNGLSINGTPSSTQGSCSVTGQNVSCNVGTLHASGNGTSSATITINVTAISGAGGVCGPVNNTGHMSATGATSVDSNQVTVTINCPNFTVNLVKSTSATQVYAGQGFTYTLVATNTGGAQATNVVVSDVIPSNLTITGTPTSTKGTCSVSGQTVTCNLGTLAAANTGGTNSATITINVGTGANSCGPADNTGQVTANGGSTGNSNTVHTTILCPNLTVGVTKANNANNPGGTNFQQTETAQSPGEAFTYQVVISNNTSVDEIIDSITDTLPGQSATGVCPNLINSTLPHGQSVICQFAGTAPLSLGASLTDTVNVGVHQVSLPSNTATGTATSTVLTSGQSLAGHIYLCSTSNGATTAELPGGTLSATGPATIGATGNPLFAAQVPAGSYTMTATAPTGYSLVATCSGAPTGTPAAAVSGSGTTATEGVTVPANGTGTGVFYATINTPALKVGVVKTNNAANPGGTNFQKSETAQTAGENFTYQAVISNTDDEPEAISSITDAFTGQNATNVCSDLIGKVLNPGDSVTCQFGGTAPTTDGTSLTDTVTTTVTNTPGNPPGTATGTDTSTVLTPPTVTITKANNAAGTGYGTQETAAADATSVPYQVVVTNTNGSPATITTLTDTVNGTTTDICTNLIGQVLQPGQSATCDFTGPVPTTPTTDTAGVTFTVNGVPVSGTAQSTVFPPVLGTTITPPTAPTVTAPTALPFTGFPAGKMLAAALGLVLAGVLLLVGDSISNPFRRLRMAQVGYFAARRERIGGEDTLEQTRILRFVGSMLRRRSSRRG